MARVLVKELGADVNVRDRTGGTPLCDAALANAHDKYRNTPLHNACVEGHLSIVRLLASKPGVNVEAENRDGNTPLHVAANDGHHEVMRMLVKEFGANVGPRNRHGDTPLHVAAQHVGDQSGMISMLVKELGADTAAVNVNGWAALHVAAILGRDKAMHYGNHELSGILTNELAVGRGR